jgi:hypothetical protein
LVEESFRDDRHPLIPAKIFMTLLE